MLPPSALLMGRNVTVARRFLRSSASRALKRSMAIGAGAGVIYGGYHGYREHGVGGALSGALAYGALGAAGGYGARYAMTRPAVAGQLRAARTAVGSRVQAAKTAMAARSARRAAAPARRAAVARVGSDFSAFMKTGPRRPPMTSFSAPAGNFVHRGVASARGGIVDDFADQLAYRTEQNTERWNAMHAAPSQARAGFMRRFRGRRNSGAEFL